jgi:hypothetical protein
VLSGFRNEELLYAIKKENKYFYLRKINLQINIKSMIFFNGIG